MDWLLIIALCNMNINVALHKRRFRGVMRMKVQAAWSGENGNHGMGNGDGDGE